MYLQNIQIHNFKGIQDVSISLTPGVNLLIGDNGMGKTSLLEAMTVCLSAMLKDLKGIKSRGILQDDVRFTIEESGDGSAHIHYWNPVDIACSVMTEEQIFQLNRYREDESGKVKTKTKDSGIGKWLQQKANDSNQILPLLCYQSAGRVWQVRREDFAKELKESMNDRRAGYVGCMDFSMDTKGIQSWCLKMELSAFQKQKKIQEYEGFLDTVSTFMQRINELNEKPRIFYSVQFGDLMYGDVDTAMPISKLSAGYQSLLWMVMNLAYRLAVLNPEQGNKLRESEGIVLIDEIDMHLHPKWQWNIVKALEETFPNIQFILATHSPIVISSCRNERLVLIEDEHHIRYLPNAYGLSVENVLNYWQGSSDKPLEIKSLFNIFENALEDEDYNAAKTVLDHISHTLGEDHSDVERARMDLQLRLWSEE